MIRINAFIIIICLLFFKTTYSDNVYALIAQEKKMPDDTAKVALQLRIIDLYILTGKYDSASAEINAVRALSKKINAPYGLASAMCNKAIIQYNQSQYENSIASLDSAQSLFVSIKNIPGEIKAFNHKAKALAALDKYKEALELLAISEKKALAVNDQKGLAHGYYLEGSIANDMGEYQEAGMLLQKSLDIRITIGDTAGIAASYSFIQKRWIASRKALCCARK
jgi:tetratricopeptide (TPR) repeat protein